MSEKKCSKCGASRSGPICPKCGHEHKRGGKRVGAGPKKRTIAPVVSIDGRSVTGQQHAQWLIDRLHGDFDPETETLELAGWRRLWDSLDKRIALEVRRYLYDKARGKATITVNHLHDKPIEHNVVMNLSERFRLALEKGEERVRSLR